MFNINKGLFTSNRVYSLHVYFVAFLLYIRVLLPPSVHIMCGVVPELGRPTSKRPSGERVRQRAEEQPTWQPRQTWQRQRLGRVIDGRYVPRLLLDELEFRAGAGVATPDLLTTKGRALCQTNTHSPEDRRGCGQHVGR